MTSIPPGQYESHPFISAFRFADFDVSWAGPLPRGDGFCFGSDDGRLNYTDFGGKLIHDEPDRIGSDQAINGVAFINQSMAVSTRSEVVIISINGDKPRIDTIPTGAHGVVASPNGYFIAPLGIKGFMFSQPTDEHEQSVTVSNSPDFGPNFYRVISLQPNGDRTVLAFAARQGGVAAMDFHAKDETHEVRTLAYEGLDVVDICPLAGCGLPLGAAAVGRDGTLILFRDVLKGRGPLPVKYPLINGAAYRLLSVHDKLFLLTSKGFYIITELLTRFAEGIEGDFDTPILPVPMEAVDANLGGNEWILIVMPDEVLRIDLNLLKQYKAGDNGLNRFENLHRTTMNPIWRERRVEQRDFPVFAGA